MINALDLNFSQIKKKKIIIHDSFTSTFTYYMHTHIDLLFIRIHTLISSHIQYHCSCEQYCLSTILVISQLFFTMNANLKLFCELHCIMIFMKWMSATCTAPHRTQIIRILFCFVFVLVISFAQLNRTDAISS